MLVASVVLDIKSSKFNKTFFYSVDGDTSKYRSKIDNFNKLKLYVPQIGSKVLVPFGQQIIFAYIIDLFNTEGDLHSKQCSTGSDKINMSKLKPIIAVVSPALFTKDSYEFAKWISSRYLSTLIYALKLFTSSLDKSKIIKSNGKYRLVNISKNSNLDYYVVPGEHFKTYKPSSNARIQIEIINCVNNGPILCSMLKKDLGNITSALKTLESKKVIKFLEIQNKIKIKNTKQSIYKSKKINQLTPEQSFALNEITKAQNSDNDECILLDGVTGSGKTEVYLRAIDDVLKEGKSAIVLVPEIALTPQTVARFTYKFGSIVSTVHSKMTSVEKQQQYIKIIENKQNIVIGARSALFSPVKNIGLIVIDEEHERSYKQESSPRYVTRDCAAWLARHNRCPLVLGSATPSLESIYNCMTLDNWQAIRLKKRTNNKAMPRVDVVDMGQEFKNGHHELFSTKLKTAIISCLQKGNKAIILHNRRGFANYMFCRECGYVPTCPNCSTSLTYHERLLVDSILDGSETKIYKQMLKCHHCGVIEHVSHICPKCSSPYFAKYGAGTQSVEDQLKNIINDEFGSNNNIRVVRMDADTTSQINGHQKCLEKFAKPGPAVLLGTQMIAKGLDFDDVSLVGVVLADTMLSLADFRAQENTFNLISQVAGRCGRADIPGYVVVQTYKPDDPSIICASKYNKIDFINNQMIKRKALNLPPFVNLVNVVIQSKDFDLCIKTAFKLNKTMIDNLCQMPVKNTEITKATNCVLGKIRGYFRYHFFVKIPHNISVSNAINSLMQDFKQVNNVKIIIDVDAYSVL